MGGRKSCGQSWWGDWQDHHGLIVRKKMVEIAIALRQADRKPAGDATDRTACVRLDTNEFIRRKIQGPLDQDHAHLNRFRFLQEGQGLVTLISTSA